MTETTQTERQRILNVGCAPNGRNMRRLAADVEECADRLQRAEELLRQANQHVDTCGDHVMRDEINAFLGGHHDD